MLIQSLAKKTLIFISLFLSFFCISCKTKNKWHSTTFVYFDTVCEIKIFCPTPDFSSGQEEALRVFSEIEGHFSPGSEDFSSPIVLDLYHRALDIHKDTNGCFDITVGPLSRLWGFLDKPYRVPPKKEIDMALNFIGMDKISEQDGILILDPNMKLDWGGIAKGLGIDLAFQSLRRIGIKRGFINAGGDLFCWGKNPDNDTWKVGLKHPRKKGYLGIISLSDCAAATTGDYQRGFEFKGIRYHHVFNPRTGYPAQGKQSVTVIGPETLICDGLSTALFVCNNPQKILENYPQYGVIIVDSEGKVYRLGKPYRFQLL